MSTTITTPNMLEVAYLLERHHQITHVSTQTTWPYGIAELAVTLSGEQINLDHHNFLRHGTPHSLTPLSLALKAVQIVVDRQAEDAAFAGGKK